jgi:predicted dinucleotide-binding enzyme
MSKRIAIIGVGNVGGALGARLSESGFEVRYGVKAGRDPGEKRDKLGADATLVPAGEAAAWAEVVFLAVPAKAAVDVATGLGDLTGKVLVDCNNCLRWDAGPVWDPPPEGSLTAALAKAAPSAKVVKAFNVFGAEFHRDPKIGDASIDVFVAGDDAEAKTAVSDIARAAGFAPVDAGPLRNAAVLENVAILWIHLAMVGGQGRDFAFKMLRRAGPPNP